MYSGVSVSRRGLSVGELVVFDLSLPFERAGQMVFSSWLSGFVAGRAGSWKMGGGRVNGVLVEVG